MEVAETKKQTSKDRFQKKRLDRQRLRLVVLSDWYDQQIGMPKRQRDLQVGSKTER